jgi:hypothetical protein
MPESPRSLPSHRVLLVLAGVGWFLSVGGFAYAWLFTSDAVGPKSVMSSRTFTTLLAFWAGWWVAAAAFAVSLLALTVPSRRSPAMVWSARISGALFLPATALLAYAIVFQ